MMNVEEKQEFFAQRQKLLQQLQDESGISFAKITEMQEQGINMKTFKQLPAC